MRRSARAPKTKQVASPPGGTRPVQIHPEQTWAAGRARREAAERGVDVPEWQVGQDLPPGVQFRSGVAKPFLSWCRLGGESGEVKLWSFACYEAAYLCLELHRRRMQQQKEEVEEPEQTWSAETARREAAERGITVPEWQEGQALPRGVTVLGSGRTRPFSSWCRLEQRQA
jgi:hypothetical protein